MVLRRPGDVDEKVGGGEMASSKSREDNDAQSVAALCRSGGAAAMWVAERVCVSVCPEQTKGGHWDGRARGALLLTSVPTRFVETELVAASCERELRLDLG